MGTVSNRNLFAPSQGPPVDSSQCPQCGSSFVVAGPLWADELHNQEFIQGLLESMKQLKMSENMGAHVFHSLRLSEKKHHFLLRTVESKRLDQVKGHEVETP
ncbi:unnamed protein product [Rodentolepis nana]|uniref:Ovule protein n=1 Tax=Rodentolepis nana TaxID=102285 RepID=A0A0R3TNQ0_RODNA|nr:unnamed protein product [Rodentolepis nana]